jgi:glycosyltransferase involved in cell wall biosynthesis
MIGDTFPGRVGLQQRVLPSYRALFFDRLAEKCLGGLSVFAGEPLPNEGIKAVEELQTAKYVKAKNRYFGNPVSSWFICWQDGYLQWLEDWQPEILIVEANPRYTTTRRAIEWMKSKGRKVIGWGLGAPPIHGPLAGLRQRERQSLLRSLDAVIAYSQLGLEQYRQLGLLAERVYVATNAVEPAPTKPPPPRPGKIEGQASVLFVGRLQTRKRVDLLIKACAGLPKELQPHLIIVGDGPARNEFQNLARNLYPAAEFVGEKHAADLEPYFTQADLFVLPGTGGLAIQQAMAHGLPVIVARGDGTQDDLVRAENGWQVAPDDLVGLTKVLQFALSDPAKLRHMGEISYRIVSTEINVEKMVEAFITVLNSLRKN